MLTRDDRREKPWTFVSGVVAMTSAALACGGDSGGSDIDGGPGEVDGDVPIWEEVYDDPGDFDRSICDGDVGDVASPEIWHFGADTEKQGHFGPYRPIFFRPQGDVVRWTGGAGDLGARVSGRAWEDASQSEGDVFFRHRHYVNFHQLVWSFTACGTDDDGHLAGRFADCWFVHMEGEYDPRCREASFRAARLEALGDSDAAGLSELARYDGPEGGTWNAGERAATAVAAQGDFVYVARAGAGLRIIDVSDPSDPSEVGFLAPADEDDGERSDVGQVDVALAEGEGDARYAYVAFPSGSFVADVSDPEDPIEVGELSGAQALFVHDDRLYAVTGSGASLAIYDISDRQSPVALGSYANPDASTWSIGPQSQPPPADTEALYDVHADGERVYISHGRLGVIVLDTADPDSPERIAAFDEEGTYARASAHVAAPGGDVLVMTEEQFGGGLRVLGGDPESDEYLAPIADYDTRPEVAPGRIAVAGERVYVAYHQDGLRVLDLGDPESPAEVGHYNTWPGPEDAYGDHFAEGAKDIAVDPERDLVFVADTHRGLAILEPDP